MMQTQKQRQQITSISAHQSLAVVKTLLSSSFGCIAYIRNLLPEDCFGESYLTTSKEGSMSYASSSQDTAQSGQTVSSMKIKTVKRGYSTESDKLLDFLEKGIFEAIEKQYLRSFIFAIYLDNEDPNNIVESYTYNFTYHAVPGTDITVPIMSFEGGLARLSLNDRSRPSDPVMNASLKGLAPTLGDVKKSLRAMIKRLILITQDMDALPKRRFATYKLFYRDNAPDDYEPPFFRPGDSQKDKFVFTTHGRSEAPEKWSIGSVTTPHHSVAVQIKSIVRFLPSEEDNEAPFAGHVSALDMPKKDNFDRAIQVEAQAKDAENRNVAWDAEDADAEWEPDPEYVNDSGIALTAPLGLRASDKTVINVKAKGSSASMGSTAEVTIYGFSEDIPSQVGHMLANEANSKAGYSDINVPTQRLEQTQLTDDCMDIRSEIFESGQSFMTNGIETQGLKEILTDHIRGSGAVDSAMDDCMLDMETQVTNFVEESEAASRSVGLRDDSDEVNCACGATEDDGCVQCEGACKRWFHLWCMGYHSQKDVRLPAQFLCLDCRLRDDENFVLVEHKYSNIMDNWSNIAQIRRAIKLVETHSPKSLQAFKGVAAFDKRLAEQLFKRLENEGFIMLESTETNSLGLLATQTTSKSRPAKNKRKTKTSSRYIFNGPIIKTLTYQKYFTPDSREERQMLGLIGPKGADKDKRKSKEQRREPPATPARAVLQPNMPDAEVPQTPINGDIRSNFSQPGFMNEVEMGSQTQNETQCFVAPDSVNSKLKRKGSVCYDRHDSKRLKISVVEGIDIEE